MPKKARIYIGAVLVLGAACMAGADWRPLSPTEFLCFFCVAALVSGMKVRLPGILGTLSVNFLFILVGILSMTSGEAIAIGCASALVQCLWKPKHPVRTVQAAFSVMNVAIAVAASYAFYHWPLVQRLNGGMPIALMASSLLYFSINTAGIALVIALTEEKPLVQTWRECYFWSFPFYLVAGSIVWGLTNIQKQAQWHNALFLLPIIYLIYRSYRIYLENLEVEKKHIEQMAALHLRTIEALASAIEAKDQTTHTHLGRVRTYAVELGKKMGLPEPELEALRAAALLHDIGKLAVPEHIICKPGKLTPQEFEKMKIHPVVGAEILERVEFPYAVVPIVRAHHEKWDGSGYPDGLKAEEIPMGARILAAVDTLDALASDRQYRRAQPLDEAMCEVEKRSGTAFDPAVVAALKRSYNAFEQMVASRPQSATRLSTDLKIERGAAPEAGYEISGHDVFGPVREGDFLTSIAAARQEVQLLFELTQELGNSLSLDETLSVFAARMKHMIPYDAIAIYLNRDGRLSPAYVNGENFRLLSSLQVPVGGGLSGWVAQAGKWILNGDPSVETGYLGDPAEFTTLKSAVSVPLVAPSGRIDVLTLYRNEKEAFSPDHLRILLAVSSKVALAIENALRFRQAETSATTDYLTGLPNARSLFLHLDDELARCKRTQEPLTVLVCDLDGFKETNDRYGHLEGNRALQAVANSLRESCREYDYVARMGGDEFVVVLPASNANSLKKRIPQFRRIDTRAGTAGDGIGELTMSIGAAFFPEDGTDAEQLLAEADRRMYADKQSSKARRSRLSLVRAESRLTAVQ
ncbi:MAG TPA: HD domain-containing phosphohydrolase [Bryobacteraceae bacterium]|nr:HD domain-containing phosphohydrolase [Bryobacteraceae bacterium]